MYWNAPFTPMHLSTELLNSNIRCIEMHTHTLCVYYQICWIVTLDVLKFVAARSMRGACTVE